MQVNKLVIRDNLVRADSPAAANGFGCEDEDVSSYFIPMNPNSDHLYIRRTIKEGRSVYIEPDYILVFNINHNIAGIVRADRMVKPVNMKVQVTG